MSHRRGKGPHLAWHGCATLLHRNSGSPLAWKSRPKINFLPQIVYAPNDNEEGIGEFDAMPPPFCYNTHYSNVPLVTLVNRQGIHWFENFLASLFQLRISTSYKVFKYDNYKKKMWISYAIILEDSQVSNMVKIILRPILHYARLSS